MPINTSKLTDTALTTALGAKIAQGQAESAYISAGESVDRAVGAVRTAKGQEAQASMNYNESVLKLDEAEVNRPSSDIANDIAKNESEQATLQGKIDEYNKKYDPETGGTGIPSRQAQS